jgi:hypothetical protein
VHTPRRSATWRTVSSGGFRRRSSNNRVTKSLGFDGRNVVAWDPASALTVPFDEGREPSGRVVDSPCADSEAEGHWFESRYRRSAGSVLGRPAVPARPRGNRTAIDLNQPLMNASRSALIVSACVVGIPCGKPL